MTSVLAVIVGTGEDGIAITAASATALGWHVALSPIGRLADTVARELAASDEPFIALVRAGGELTPAADLAVAQAADAGFDVLYADELVGSGRSPVHLARPDHSPERLRSQYFWGDFVVYARPVLAELGVDQAMVGAELYDLALRSAAAGCGIGHSGLAAVRRVAERIECLDEEAVASTGAALERYLESTGGGEVLAIGRDGVHDTRRPVRGEPLVSIVIPTRGIWSEIGGVRSCFVLDAVRSIVERSSWPRYEVVLVVDDGADADVLAEIGSLLGERMRVVRWAKPFNFSGKINAGVLGSEGEYVLLLNDDVRVIEPRWIESLLALAQLPGAGMSGCMLYFGDGSIQHAGHAYYDNDASHIGLDRPGDDPGPIHGYRVEREVSGVTAACAMMPRAVFFEVGGLSTLLPGNFNDVDLCMKVTWIGYQVYWTPHASLYHYESKTRDPSVHNFEVDVAWGRWGFRMDDRRYWPYPHTRPPARSDIDRW